MIHRRSVANRACVCPGIMMPRWDANGDVTVTEEEFVTVGQPADHFEHVDTTRAAKLLTSSSRPFRS